MGSVALSAWFKCIKYSMFVFCLIAWLIGLITFIIGIVARVKISMGPLDEYLPVLQVGANLLISVGFFIMLIGFLGCCGAIRESQCMLFSFFLAVFFCFTLLMAAGLWAIAWSHKLDSFLYRFLENRVVDYREEEKRNINTILMDFLQQKFHCCGVTSAADYGTKSIPKTCGSTEYAHANLPGCHTALKDIFEPNLSIITGIGIAFAVIMIIGMVCSMMLCCALREIS